MKRPFVKISKKGFTLVELMIVVAIIGILAAIAIPNFQKYQAKSRTTEAKIALSAVFTGQKSFHAEWNGYVACMGLIGYGVDSVNRFYAVGHTTGPTAGPLIGSPSCAAAGPTVSYFVATQGYGGAPAVLIPLASVAAANTFLAGASGLIFNAGNDDWTMSDVRTLSHAAVGY